jgi:glycosyltransferase involved in cell wall biosynthesis
MTATSFASASPQPGGASSAQPRCRVLQVFDTLGMGGAETWLLELLRWFRVAAPQLPVRLETEICLTSGERGRFDGEAEALGARLHYVRYGRRRLPEFTRAFRALLAERRFDAIHDHEGFAAGIHLACGIGQLPSVRIVHFHNPTEGLTPTLPRRALWAASRYAIGKLATRVAGTSEYVLSQHGFAPGAQRRVASGAVHCGFDPRRFDGDRAEAHADVRDEFGWPEDAKLVLFVGRLESHFNQKNPGFALDVVRECARRDGAMRALFVGGGGDAKQRFEEQVDMSGLSDRIRFAGTRSDIPRLMLAADLLLFPSIAEGLGMVAVEAQAAGTPVLASDTTPVECRVVSSLVSFMPLTESAGTWAQRALAMMRSHSIPHHEALAAVERSPFAIANSAAALLALYHPASAGSRLTAGGALHGEGV